MNDFLPVLEIIVKKIRADLRQVADCIYEHIGEIELKGVKKYESIEYEGKVFNGSEFFFASIKPKGKKVHGQ